MKITFWGTRGSIASPGPDTIVHGGNTTCLEIETAAGGTVIVDAGTGIRTLGDVLLARGEPISAHLLMTHIHWDHVWGFAFFGPLFQTDSRIVVDGSPRGMEGLRRVFSRDYVDGTWPIRFEDLKARIEVSQRLCRGQLSLDGTVVESHYLQHPQGGMGFKFTEDERTFVFLTDNELLDKPSSGPSFRDFALFCRNADILVHDCQYLPEEMEIKQGWGHSDLNSVVRLALEADVRRLILFHHDPWRTDAAVSSMVERCAKMLASANSEISAEAAQEGSTLEL
ncbi:MAG: MBL fold metallo-hydrolase [Desulfomonilaceae bacterium]